MTAEAVRSSSTSEVTLISAGRRLRVLRSLHARLIHFPQQDEVLVTLLSEAHHESPVSGSPWKATGKSALPSEY
jgi:hypothetical protein